VQAYWQHCGGTVQTNTIETLSPSNTLKRNAIAKLRSREANIGVIGLGYVGLPLALLFSEECFRVMGFDIDERKVETLASGESYMYRLPNTEIRVALDRGFAPTSDFNNISSMDVVVICVPTPLNDHREPDLSYITNTVQSISPYLRAGQLLVLESTTYPGTTNELVLPLIERHCSNIRVSRDDDSDCQDVVFLAFSPEREDPSNNTIARRDIPKVVGGIDRHARDIAVELYSSIFRHTVPVSSTSVAEMTKLLENIYRCVNIALVNELKLLCLRLGIDIWEVIAAASSKPFGFQPFYPGPGLGGHCIPIDPFYLSWKAKECDFSTRFIELAGEINTAMPYHIVDFISQALNRRHKPMNGARVLVLGISYKKDIDDLRESPALTIIESLQASGAQVSYNDPHFPSIGRGRKYNLNLSSVPLEHLDQYDCVAIITDHSDYDYATIVEQSQLVIDTRNATAGICSSNIVRC
jgi:UDP-N-acetyl-D-glucosamine dehydrogenase